MDRFILYRVRENGSPAPPMHERIRSVRYEKVHDTFSLTVLIETKAPSMSMMKKEIKGFQTAWILFKCQRSRWSWKMKMMLLLVTMTIRTTVMTPEDFGRCRVNDIRKFSSPVSVVIPRITFESTAEQNGNHLGTSYIYNPILDYIPWRRTACPSEISGNLKSHLSLLFCYKCLSDHFGVGIISRSIWGSLRGYCVSIQWLPTGFLQKIQ